jgi:hypothetical protein
MNPSLGSSKPTLDHIAVCAGSAYVTRERFTHKHVTAAHRQRDLISTSYQRHFHQASARAGKF